MNNEATVIDPGNVSYLKPGDTAYLPGPIFSLQTHDLENGNFVVRATDILAVKC